MQSSFVVFAVGLKKFNKEQKNPLTTAVHKMWEEAKKFQVPEVATVGTPVVWLKTDDEELAVRPMFQWHVNDLVASFKEKWSGTKINIVNVK